MIRHEVCYSQGLREGEVTHWYDTGRMAMQGNYVKGLKDGWWITCDKYGYTISEEWFEQGQLITAGPPARADSLLPNH